MPRIFVSAQAVDRSPARDLVSGLRGAGVEVVHSPSNPLDGPDEAWTDWYAQGLREAVCDAGIAVLVVDDAWASSTWMAEEAHLAHSELGPDRVAFWNPDRAIVTAPVMLSYLKARLPDDLTDAVALLSGRATSGLHASVDMAVRDQWRELGFFYEVDDNAKAWRFRGSSAGLGRLVADLDTYVRKPTSTVEGEHEHLGPYMYLKIMTASNGFVNGDAIAGTLKDLSHLARLLENRLIHAVPGASFSIQREFLPTAEYALEFRVEPHEFDPATQDSSILTMAG